MNATNGTKYTVEVVAPGTWMLADTSVRAHVRGFALDFAWKAAKYQGASLRIRSGAKFSGGRILACYNLIDGRWVHAYGNTVEGLEGLDGAGCYMAKYPLPHVTREYAEGMARGADARKAVGA